jgi:hypothetical protein
MSFWGQHALVLQSPRYAPCPCPHQVVAAWRQHLAHKQRLAAAAARLQPLQQRLQLLAAWQRWRHLVDSTQAADAAAVRCLVVQRAVLGWVPATRPRLCCST